MADPGGVNPLGLIVMVFQVLSVSCSDFVFEHMYIAMAVGQRRSRANRCARLIVVAQVVPKSAAQPVDE